MKKLLLILICLPLMTLAQQTYVPDDNFENYLEAYGLGDGVYLNDSVFTSAIDTLLLLDIPANSGVADLTGLSDFVNLMTLRVANQNITELDLSALTKINTVYAGYNNIININTLGADSLHRLYVEHNNLTQLDVSANHNMTYLSCTYNNLVCLNIGDNKGFIPSNHPSSSDWGFAVHSNDSAGGFGMPSLYCIQTTNVGWCQANLSIPSHMYFSSSCDTNCTSSPLSIIEHTTNKELLQTIDVLGRETKGKKNEPLFYIYVDGTVEKKIIIE